MFRFRSQKWLKLLGFLSCILKFTKRVQDIFVIFCISLLSLCIVCFVGPCSSLKWDILCVLRIDTSNSLAYKSIFFCFWSQYVKGTDCFPLLAEVAMANRIHFYIFAYKPFVRVAHVFRYFLCHRNTMPILEEDSICKN